MSRAASAAGVKLKFGRWRCRRVRRRGWGCRASRGRPGCSNWLRQAGAWARAGKPHGPRTVEGPAPCAGHGRQEDARSDDVTFRRHGLGRVRQHTAVQPDAPVRAREKQAHEVAARWKMRSGESNKAAKFVVVPELGRHSCCRAASAINGKVEFDRIRHLPLPTRATVMSACELLGSFSRYSRPASRGPGSCWCQTCPRPAAA